YDRSKRCASVNTHLSLSILGNFKSAMLSVFLIGCGSCSTLSSCVLYLDCSGTFKGGSSRFDVCGEFGVDAADEADGVPLALGGRVVPMALGGRDGFFFSGCGFCFPASFSVLAGLSKAVLRGTGFDEPFV